MPSGLTRVHSASTVHSPQRTQTQTLESFQESISETKERENTECKLFAYMLQKYVMRHLDDCSGKQVLLDVRNFIAEAQSCDNQPSKVHYMELVDENPDSDETMALIADDLLQKFANELSETSVVLVGDGKTYQHLMNIKRLYGPAFHNLLIFPGDWHTTSDPIHLYGLRFYIIFQNSRQSNISE